MGKHTLNMSLPRWLRGAVGGMLAGRTTHQLLLVSFPPRGCVKRVRLLAVGLLVGCGGGSSFEAGQKPVIDYINPSRIPAHSTAVTLIVYGAAFTADAKAIVNGAVRPINYADPSSLEAILSNEDVAEPGTVEIAIDNGSAGGRSNSVTLQVVNQPGRIFSISPSEVVVGSAAFPDTVFGGGFLPSTVVRINGHDRTTKVVDNTTVVVQVEAADVAQTGNLRISTFTPPPQGGSSNEVVLPVLINQQITSHLTLDIRGQRVIADPVRPVLYLSVIAPEASGPGTVAAIDPATGAVTRSFQVGSAPGPMTISADGHYLYVASGNTPSLDRIDLVTGAVLPISLQLGAQSDEPRALDMVALSDAPGSVVVTLDQSSAPNTPGMVVFDGAVPRPRPTTISMSQIEPGVTANVIYGQLGTSFYRLVVDPDGIRVATEIPGLTEILPSGIQQVGGKVYAANGEIYDLEAGRVLGRFTRGTGTFYIDGLRGRAFFVQGNVFEVWAASLATDISLGTVLVPDAGDGLRGNITSFGTDGLALFTEDQRLILLHSTLVSQ